MQIKSKKKIEFWLSTFSFLLICISFHLCRCIADGRPMPSVSYSWLPVNTSDSGDVKLKFSERNEARNFRSQFQFLSNPMTIKSIVTIPLRWIFADFSFIKCTFYFAGILIHSNQANSSVRGSKCRWVCGWSTRLQCQQYDFTEIINLSDEVA